MNYEQLLLGDNNIKCNMLLIGKTGSGKSSFANYLFGTDKFSASSGKPVTNWENNFQFNSIDISGIKVNIFDSVGLEADNHKKWENELYKFLENKQTNNSPNEHIHTFFYVVNAAGARIEENELSILINIQKRFKLSTAIILTNSDIVTNEQIENLEKIIKKEKLKSIRVCSIAKKTRAGNETKTFGKEESLEILLSSSYEKVGKDFSLGIIDFMEKQLSDTKKKILYNLEKSDISIFNISNIDKELEKIMQKLESDMNIDIEKLIPKEYISYSNFLNSFNIEYRGKEYKDIIDESFNNIDFDSLFDENILMKKIKNLEEKFENDSIWDKISGVLDAGIMLLKIKSLIKEGIEECFMSFNKELYKVQKLVSNS